MLRKGSRLACRAVAQHNGRVNWSACLSPYSPQPLRDNLNALDARISRANNVVSSAPKSVPEVNWDKYVEAGVEPEVIAELKAEYEGHDFGEPTLGGEWKSVQGFIDHFKQVAQPKIDALQQKKADINAQKAELQEDFLTSKNWTIGDFERKYPGMLQAAHERWMVGEFFADQAMSDGIHAFDVDEVTRQLKAGETPEGIRQIPQSSLEYFFGDFMVEGENGPVKNDFSNWSNLDLPGSAEADAAWNREWGPVWAKLA